LFAGATVVDLLLRGTNLTDEVARNHVSFLKDDVPLPGRDLSLSARLTF
jgi:iron complex outermembrane receptor protein